MSFYRVYGKWYHREYSGYFEEVVRASSPRAALSRAARCLSDVERAADIEWANDRPGVLPLGQLDPEPAFWVGPDWLYKVRSITLVRPAEIECPKCHGSGRIQGYVDE